MAYQEHYTQQLLDNLRAKLLIMGSKTQQALDDAAIAVLNHDLPSTGIRISTTSKTRSTKPRSTSSPARSPLPAISAFS